MTDALDSVIDDAAAAQPTASDTGAGIRSELIALTPGASAAPAAGDAPRVSRKGETWNPAVHVSPPVETARGTWRKLGKGDAPAVVVDSAAPGSPTAATVARENCTFAFGVVAPALNQLAPLADGASWEPEDEERGSIEYQLTRFYTRYPDYMADLPPGVALLGAVAAYALPRVLALPQAQRLLSRVAQRRAQQPEAMRDAA